ncbi:MAG: heme ABC exporter ATP-binding protein CcmA [Chloroflexi bacterium]|nr:heme ABC exporter ATP-binding protein CcmA [Chloroflexota bacterium]
MVRGLRFHYGAAPVLRGVDLTLRPGDRVALFGPNGAGKTTLLRLIAGLLRPTAGEVLVCGVASRTRSAEAKRRLGLLGHQTYLYDELTAEENLRLYGTLYDLPNLPEMVREALERVALLDLASRRVGALSRGQQQRLAIARAVLHRPPLLLLDEPDTGLDLQAFELLAELLAEDRGGRAVLVATHNLAQARRTCTSAAVILGGKAQLLGPIEVLEERDLRELFSGGPVAR